MKKFSVHLQQKLLPQQRVHEALQTSLAEQACASLGKLARICKTTACERLDITLIEGQDGYPNRAMLAMGQARCLFCSKLASQHLCDLLRV
jgi:hypothetical protein